MYVKRAALSLIKNQLALKLQDERLRGISICYAETSFFPGECLTDAKRALGVVLLESDVEKEMLEDPHCTNSDSNQLQLHK